MAGTEGAAWPLIGRGGELAALDEQVGERGGAVVLVGPVGVGKSRLMAAWVAVAEAAGRTAVVVRATRSTATIPFGAFAGWVPARVGGGADRLAALQATAARLVGPEGGVLLAVDDAHLLDEGSAALVLHLVQHTSLGVVATVRQGEPCPDAVVALWKEGLAPRIDLRPLSQPQTVELLEQVLAGPIGTSAWRRVWQVTEGNPLYLREVVDAARTQGVLVHQDGVWQWRGRLRDRTRLIELVSDRIGSSEPAERQLLDTVALGEPLPLGVAARLAPRALLTQAESRGLVVVDPASASDATPTIRLAHPLYSELLRAELPPFTARDLSGALADAAVAAGMDRSDPVRVATWLLDGCRDGDGDSGGEPAHPAHPGLLLRASLRARVVDEYELSLRFAEAAEQAGGGWRATLRRAIALGPLGRLHEADAVLSSLSQPEREPQARVEAALVRAEQSFWHRGDDLSVARAIVAEAAEGVPAPARSILLSHGAQLALIGLDLDETIRLAGQAYAEAGSLQERLHAVTTAGLAAAFLGRTRAALAASKMARHASLEMLDADPVPGLLAARTYSLASVLDGRIDQAATIFDTMLDNRYGLDRGVSYALLAYWAGRGALEQGRVAAAVRRCGEALGLLGDENHYGRGTWVANVLARAAAQAGETGIAEDTLAWVEAHTRARVESDVIATELARAWLHAARGELSAARELALTAAQHAAGRGAWMLEMTALLDAARLGAAGAAAPRLGQLAQLIEGPYAVAAARFARAAADQDGAGLDAAAGLFAAMGARLHAAEAAAAASEAHGADGQYRRQAASRANAQDLAGHCEGATTPLLARLDQEPLVRVLTEREQEVAELAARGLTSQEIAETLYISVRTVHSHLNHTYTKLGISGRSELAAALGHRPATDRTRSTTASGVPSRSTSLATGAPGGPPPTTSSPSNSSRPGWPVRM